MMTFIHTYTEKSFPGLIRQGLFRDGDGLKMMHKNYLPPSLTFNQFASESGALYRTLKELRCPFYIDRFQGGMPFPYAYSYDPALLARYRDMLGDNFWGFQMHEWASNYRYECFRVIDAIHNWRLCHTSRPLREFWSEMIEKAQIDPMALFVEANSVEEWSKLPFPESAPEFVGLLHQMWDKRRHVPGGPLIPVDSYYMAPKIEIAGGARLLLPEVGWQIPGTRFQLAYTRGMAKAAGIRWGVYYECWGWQKEGQLTISYCLDEAENEWTEDKLLMQLSKQTEGKPEKGGSSRSLQERIWLASYFAGATVIGEEYGVCNTFRNLRDFELGEYGQVKKRFLEFSEKYPDLGKPFTPVAIVLPAELELYTLNESEDVYLQYPLAGEAYFPAAHSVDDALSEKIRNARNVIGRLLFRNHRLTPTVGRDDHCLQNGKYPDVFDVIHADQEEAIASYDYLIDLTGDPAFASRHSNVVTEEELPLLLRKILPCTVEGELQYLINRTETGWLVLILNNDGVINRDYQGEIRSPEAAVAAEVRLRNPSASVRVLEGGGRLSSDKERYTVMLDAGRWILLGISEN